MVITALDTYQLVKDPRAVGFTDEQAETLTSVLRKTQDVDLSHLATKDDLAAQSAATKADITALSVATKADIAALAAATKSDMAELKVEIFRAMFGQTLLIIGAIVALLKTIGH